MDCNHKIWGSPCIKNLVYYTTMAAILGLITLIPPYIELIRFFTNDGNEWRTLNIYDVGY